MIAHMLGVALASASGSSGNGHFRRNTIVLSSGADSSSVRAISAWPNGSRAPQRRMLATQSRASTFCPSWKTSPSRSVTRQVRPSSSTRWPAAIWGVALNPPSGPVTP